MSTTLKPTTRSATKLPAVASPKVTHLSASTSSTNDDIMTALSSLRNEFSESFKNQSIKQDNLFKELKADIVKLSSLIAVLKAENNILKLDFEFLKDKVDKLESLDSPASSSSVVTQVFQETFERERCSTNLLVYSIPESSAESTSQSISDDKSALEKIVVPLIGILPARYKLIRLGKAQPNNTRLLKIILESKECASNILFNYHDAKKSGINLPPNFRIAKDKTLLQRTLLRNCHSELDRRTQAGEV
jgi:hypothetical protein